VIDHPSTQLGVPENVDLVLLDELDEEPELDEVRCCKLVDKVRQERPDVEKGV
jgi:hypothetical protein